MSGKMAPSAIQVKAFINRNIVSIVMVSGLIFVHWSWFKLQEIRYIREGQLDKSRSPILESNETILEKIKKLTNPSMDEKNQN